MGDKILVADDDPDILRLIEVTLVGEGYDLATAPDGEQALSVAQEDPPDLAILDVTMPKVDGFELCRRLRQSPRTSNVSIIMLTAKSQSVDKVMGLAAGADDYVLKPFDPLELIARVKTTLRRAREMRALNPLSGLPGNVAITEELQRRIASDLPFALMHVDLDNFKAFNDHYGFVRGDVAIKMTARVLQEALLEHDPATGFAGHVGGDDFAAICDPEIAEELAKEIIARFDEQVDDLYDAEDAQRGAIVIADRKGEMQEFPIMSISIGIATNVRRRIGSHLEASEIAGELKRLCKLDLKSAYAVDRRSGDEERAASEGP